MKTRFILGKCIGGCFAAVWWNRQGYGPEEY